MSGTGASISGRTAHASRYEVICWLCAIAFLSAPSNVDAHEIGTTRVSATIGATNYTIDLVLDPAALLAKLEALAGRPRSGPLTAAQYQARIEALQAAFLSHVAIRFDDRVSQPRFEYLPSGSFADPMSHDPTTATSTSATIRLTGAVPPGARTLTWAYGLTFSSYALTMRREREAAGATVWLDGGQSSVPFRVQAPEAPLSRTRIAMMYFGLGFTHIVPKGVDHMLFVLGIFLLGRRIRSILCQVSAFTLAHSMTLGLSVYGVVRLPPSVVEPLIALSITYVAVENIWTSELKPWRVALVFAFGLLHGLGFAGALGQIGLPRSEFLTGLVTFNAGVEAGQLSVIALASLVVAHWSSCGDWYRRRIVVPSSAAIAAVGLYWTVVRII
jgi:hypothetical protein